MNPAYDSAGKRKELVRAAKELFHHEGFHKTTLQMIARSAGVPLGNVHYYFPSKQSLAEAVIASHLSDLQTAFASWESEDPLARLRTLIRSPLRSVDSVVQFGCPHGSLCQELQKDAESPLARAGAGLLQAWIDWSAEQLTALGWEASVARQMAGQLVAAIQGTMLLAQTFRSPELLTDQLGRVESWLEEQQSSSAERRKA